MGPAQVEAFLNHLAVDRKVSASTQSQALNALVFLYKDVLKIELGKMEGLNRLQRRHRIPVVLTPDEVRRILGLMKGTTRTMAELLNGAGLRVSEVVTLRIKDLDFADGSLAVCAGKGSKDRKTVLPQRLIADLKAHLLRVVDLHRQDLATGSGFAPMPGALSRKYPRLSP